MPDPLSVDLASTLASYLAWIESHPGLASWVQGVGTLAAVIVAFIALRQQLRAQFEIQSQNRRDNLNAERRRMQAIHAATMSGVDRLVGTMDAVMNMLTHEVVGPVTRKLPAQIFAILDRERRATDRMDLFALGDETAIKFALSVLAWFDTFDMRVRATLREGISDNGFSQALEGLADHRNHASGVADELRTHLHLIQTGFAT